MKFMNDDVYPKLRCLKIYNKEFTFANKTELKLFISSEEFLKPAYTSRYLTFLKIQKLIQLNEIKKYCNIYRNLCTIYLDYSIFKPEEVETYREFTLLNPRILFKIQAFRIS
jgi:hypothetical protein